MHAKTAQFSLEQQQLSRLGKAISHPARIAILQLLAAKESCISGDISKEIPQLNRVTVSQHLQELKALGLIRGEVEGVRVCYCIDRDAFQSLKTAFTAFFEQNEAAMKACDPETPTCC